MLRSLNSSRLLGIAGIAAALLGTATLFMSAEQTKTLTFGICNAIMLVANVVFAVRKGK
jgi:hypothetical protein